MRLRDDDRRQTASWPLWDLEGQWRTIGLWTLLGAGWAVSLAMSLGDQSLWSPNSWALGLALLATWKFGPRVGVTVRLVCELLRWNLLPRQFWTVSAVGQSFGALLAAALLILWVHRRRKAWQWEHDQARLDPLTQLPNRQALEEQLVAELSRARRFHRSLSVFMLDCDGFKGLNDTLGHAAGDDALRLVAKTLRSVVREYDIVARYGGDEFVLILPESDLPNAETVAERLQTTFAYSVSRQYPSLTASLGVAVFRSAPPEIATCIELADATMYRAKRAGKNRTEFEVWEPTPADDPLLKPFDPDAAEMPSHPH
jgi:diguanylate cyclase (GGDEF)-like protein